MKHKFRYTLHIYFRRRRLYKTLDLKTLLGVEGISTDFLMPKQQSGPVFLNTNEEDPAPFPPYLPLHIFDNEEFDSHLPDEWTVLGEETGNRKPVPGYALLPVSDKHRDCKFMNIYHHDYCN